MPMDILLISLGISNSDSRKSIPLALPTLKGMLEKNGFSSYCIDGTNNPLPQQKILDIIKEFKPSIVGLSATAYEILEIKRINRLIKSYSVEIFVIVGGYCSLIPDLIQKTGVDIVCHGEGDYTIIELVDFLLNYNVEKLTLQGLERIKGISYRVPISNKIIKTKKKELIQNLDQLPIPDFSDFHFENHKQNSPHELWIPIYSQRGCYNNCIFCDIIPFYGKRGIRSMNPKNIISWMTHYYNSTGCIYFLFTDDNFFSKRKFVEQFIEAYYNSQLIGKIWISIQSRAVDIIRFKDLLEKIKLLVVSIELGIESFSDTQLKRFKKNISQEQNLKAIQLLNEKEIPYHLYYMFIDKETTIEELEENINTILSLEPVPSFNIKNSLPEIVINYQYSVLSDLYGNSTVEGIGYLEVFEYFLEETELIRNLFVIYKTLAKFFYEEKSKQNQNKESRIEEEKFSNQLFLSLFEGFGNNIVEMGRTRLKVALELSKKYKHKERKFQKQKDRKIKREIKKFNGQVEAILKPFEKMGVDFNTITKNY